jgi:biopolymer transport protein ExbD
MIEFDTGKKIRPKITIAPLIDVVFLLLIFFLLSSYFVRQPGIKLTLPAASAAQPQDACISIYIGTDNDIYLDDAPAPLEGLEAALVQKMQGDTERVIVLKADEKIDLGLAVRVMDSAKKAGARHVVVSTQEPRVTHEE